MSEDFIDGLRDDLVGAMDGYERRRRRALEAYLPRRAAVLRAIGVAAAATAVVVGAHELQRPAPPARPHVTAVLPIGGIPVDAAFSGGSLWVSDFTGSLVEVDTSAQRVTRRIRVPGQPEAVAAHGGSVWALLTGQAHCGGDLLRYDANSGRRIERRPLPYPSEGAMAGGLVAGADGVWVKSCATRDGIDRLGPRSAVSAREPLANVDGVTVSSGTVWAISHDGTLAELDAASDRPRHRWRRLAPLSDLTFTYATSVLAADRAGVWVLSTGRAAILRIERGRVVRDIAVDATARPLLAAAGDDLWVAATDDSGTGNHLSRFDPRTGRPNATVDLGTLRPTALIPDGDRLCVVTEDGRILFVGT